ncbi:MAG: hypothetical protein HC896_12830 [Bacteroidales bacterium]|nr:hypothetical protein [Bacteroidales bacterium]
MKTIDFNKNDFPITTNVLQFLQEQAQLTEMLGQIFGNIIISGCTLIGNSRNPGWVYINGEIMPYTGGQLQGYFDGNDWHYFFAIETMPAVTITVGDGNYTIQQKRLINSISGNIQEFPDYYFSVRVRPATQILPGKMLLATNSDIQNRIAIRNGVYLTVNPLDFQTEKTFAA